MREGAARAFQQHPLVQSSLTTKRKLAECQKQSGGRNQPIGTMDKEGKKKPEMVASEANQVRWGEKKNKNKGRAGGRERENRTRTSESKISLAGGMRAKGRPNTARRAEYVSRQKGNRRIEAQ